MQKGIKQKVQAKLSGKDVSTMTGAGASKTKPAQSPKAAMSANKRPPQSSQVQSAAKKAKKGY